MKNQLESGDHDSFEMLNGVVYKKNDDNPLFYVPQEMEEEVIRTTHEHLGHLGIEKCYRKIKTNYWFPDMRNKINKFTKNCIRCIMYSPSLKPNERLLHNIPKEPTPFHTIHIDHLGPLPSLQSKRKHILVIIDSFTKYVKLYPVLTTSTREVNASLNKYFEYYSRPVRCITDRGSCFTSKDFSEVMESKNIKHVKVAVHSPQANGQVERVNRTLVGMLAKFCTSIQHADWVKHIAKIEFALNNTVNRSIGMTPSQALFGVNQRGPLVDKLTEYLEDCLPQRGRGNMEELRDIAKQNIEKVQNYNLKQSELKNRNVKTFHVGDFVVIKNVDTTVGTNKKLLPKFKGPYAIHKVLPNDRYVIRDIENCQITQIPYNGVVEACNIKMWKTNSESQSST